MEFAKEKSAVKDIITPLVESLDLQVVECVHNTQGAFHTIRVVLFAENGVGTDECASVYRLVMPRLEIHLNSKNISLEISSPGIRRKLKSTDEYTIFMGKPIRLLSQGEWYHGVIQSVSEVGVTVKLQNEETQEFAFDSIQKATLDT